MLPTKQVSGRGLVLGYRRRYQRTRPKKLLEDIAQPDCPFTEVVTNSLDTPSTSAADFEEVQESLRKNAISVIPLWSLEVIAEVNKLNSQETAHNIRRGLRSAANKGFYVKPRPPFGYTKIAITKNGRKRFTLVSNLKEAETVRTIWKMAVYEGLDDRNITERLNALGIQEPGNKLWTRKKVTRILED